MKYTVTVADRNYEIDIGPQGEILVNGQPRRVDLKNIDGYTLYSLILDNASYELVVEGERDSFQVLLVGELHQAQVEDERTRRLASASAAVVPSGEVTVKAPMPGLVIAVPAYPEQEVEMGQGLVILQAMKMENEIRSPKPGTVKSVRVSPGQVVEQGQVLVVIA